MEQVLQVAEGGHGLAIGRRPMVDERLARGTLVAPFGAGDPTGAAYYLCRPSDLRRPPWHGGWSTGSGAGRRHLNGVHVALNRTHWRRPHRRTYVWGDGSRGLMRPRQPRRQAPP